jgi:ankyrin repeat protein
VYCQLDYLGDCLPGRIRHALGELPETLYGTYERTLREIKSANWEFARRLFLCVAVASRPFRVEELAEFLAFDFEEGAIPKFREDWRLEDPLEAVLSTCSTLLSLVNADDSFVIQFSHFSVKEFLTSTRFAEKQDTISRRYHISMTPAHTFVAQACLAILLHLDESVSNDALKKFPLVEYAAQYWFDHARFEGVSENAEEEMKQLFDTRKPHLAVWVWIRDPIPWTQREQERPERPSPPLGRPLHYAAVCGLDSTVTFLATERPQDVHSRAFDDKSAPLHLASRMGHVDVARSLIQHGADAKAQDKDGTTPLHWAARAGNVDIAPFLIEHGADMTAQDNNGWTPMHVAVLAGNMNFAGWLVEHGADPTPQANHGLTPLHVAVEKGRPYVVRWLIEHGADTSVKNEDGVTPLHLVVLKRSVNLASLLVEHGADMTAKDTNRMTPLHWALVKDSMNVARFLIEHGADTTARDKYGATPLHLAAQKGSFILARLLVERGADPTAQANDGSTPLNWAVQSGSAVLVNLLVKHSVRYKHGRPTRPHRVRHCCLKVWQSIASSVIHLFIFIFIFGRGVGVE